MKSKIKVKVLRGYDGFTGRVVEEIERLPTYRRPRRGNRYTEVCYLGKMCKVFGLPACYGELAGLCITVK